MRTSSGGLPARPSLGFVGAGRACAALAAALRAAGYRIAAVSSRQPSDAERIAETAGARAVADAAGVFSLADLTLLTVPDPAIGGIAAAVAGTALPPSRAVVHCSARLGTEPLAPLRAAGVSVGVFHPLQALAGPKSAANLAGTAFRIDGTGILQTRLKAMADALGGSVLNVPAEFLDLYHAAAVLAGNAPLALLERAVELLAEAGVERAAARQALARLMHGAAANAASEPGTLALTGPVARGDAEAVTRHLAALSGHPETRELYRLLAQEMAAFTERDGSGSVMQAALRPGPGLHRTRVA